MDDVIKIVGKEEIHFDQEVSLEMIENYGKALVIISSPGNHIYFCNFSKYCNFRNGLYI